MRTPVGLLGAALGTALASRGAAARWCFLLAVICVGGCRLPSREGPISKQLAQCRQLADQGRATLERGDQAQACQLLAEAVRACPVDVDARRDYALVLWRCGKRDEAIKQMAAAMDLTGVDPLLAAQAGEMYLAQGKIAEAERLAIVALDYGPQTGSGWALRARVLTAQGRFEEALSDSYKALELMRDDQQLLTEIAALNTQLGRPQQALITLEVLGETYHDGNEPAAFLVEKGRAYAALGRYQDSIAALEQSLRRDQTADACCFLAEIQLRAGMPTQAHASVLRGLAIDPQHTASHQLRASMNSVAGVGGGYLR